MPSTFTWLDYSEADRRKMLDVINAFREKETRDELGFGSVRDAFADSLFPGTSTIQTRARYFFFVPWIYLRLERDRVPPSDIARQARRDEVRLIEALLRGGETGQGDGVIGQHVALQRLPSNVYQNRQEDLLAYLLASFTEEQVERIVQPLGINLKPPHDRGAGARPD